MIRYTINWAEKTCHGDHYLDIVTGLYVDDIISDDDIAGYEEENRNYIMKWKLLVDMRRGKSPM